MKIVAWFGVVGGCLGAVVAVLTHLLSKTLPTHYTVGYTQSGSHVSLGRPPLIHPSWSPTLPAAIVIGVLVGACVAFAALRLGVRISRAGQPLS